MNFWWLSDAFFFPSGSWRCLYFTQKLGSQSKKKNCAYLWVRTELSWIWYSDKILSSAWVKNGGTIMYLLVPFTFLKCPVLMCYLGYMKPFTNGPSSPLKTSPRSRYDVFTIGSWTNKGLRECGPVYLYLKLKLNKNKWYFCKYMYNQVLV